MCKIRIPDEARALQMKRIKCNTNYNYIKTGDSRITIKVIKWLVF
jgi:hypothetical protein